MSSSTDTNITSPAKNLISSNHLSVHRHCTLKDDVEDFGEKQFEDSYQPPKVFTSYGIIAIRNNAIEGLKTGSILPHIQPLCKACHTEYTNVENGMKTCVTKELSPYTILLQERKHTNAYTDIVRGQSKIADKFTLKALIPELTCLERQRLLHWDFQKLWSSLCLFQHRRRSFDNAEYNRAYNLYNERYPEIQSLLSDTSLPHYPFNEVGFPKGRKERGENGLQCAIREFCEETGYKPNEVHILDHFNTLKEEFFGSDFQFYRHIYYLAIIDGNREPTINRFDARQAGEIKNMGWYTYEQALTMFRPYDLTKTVVLKQALKTLAQMGYKV